MTALAHEARWVEIWSELSRAEPVAASLNWECSWLGLSILLEPELTDVSLLPADDERPRDRGRCTAAQKVLLSNRTVRE